MVFIDPVHKINHKLIKTRGFIAIFKLMSFLSYEEKTVHHMILNIYYLNEKHRDKIYE